MFAGSEKEEKENTFLNALSCQNTSYNHMVGSVLVSVSQLNSILALQCHLLFVNLRIRKYDKKKKVRTYQVLISYSTV